MTKLRLNPAGWIAPEQIFMISIIAVWFGIAGYVALKNPVINLSDVFGFIERAERLSFNRLDGWTHGFYPFGYPLLLKVVDSYTNDYEFAGNLISLVAGTIALVFTARIGLLLFGTGGVAPLAVLLLSINAQFLRWSTNSGTDILSVGITICAIFYALQLTEHASTRRLFAVGMLIGAAYLIRYNNLVLLPAVGVWFQIINVRSWKTVTKFLIIMMGFICITFPQLFISYLLHGNPFWSLALAQNVYFGIYGQANWGINWVEASKVNTLGEVIQKDWVAFLQNWFTNMYRIGRLELLPFPLTSFSFIGILLAFKVRENIDKHVLISVIILAYVSSISLAYTNERYLLILVPILTLYASWCLSYLLEFPSANKKTTLNWVKPFVVIALSVCIFVANILRTILDPVGEYDKVRVEVSSLVHKLGVEEASEVLSFSYDYYDLRKRTKDRYNIPWAGRDFVPYASVEDIASRMRMTGERILVFDSKSKRKVKGFDRIWPEQKTGFDEYFDLMRVLNKDVYVYKLKGS